MRPRLPQSGDLFRRKLFWTLRFCSLRDRRCNRFDANNQSHRSTRSFQSRFHLVNAFLSGIVHCQFGSEKIARVPRQFVCDIGCFLVFPNWHAIVELSAELKKNNFVIIASTFWCQSVNWKVTTSFLVRKRFMISVCNYGKLKLVKRKSQRKAAIWAAKRVVTAWTFFVSGIAAVISFSCPFSVFNMQTNIAGNNQTSINKSQLVVLNPLFRFPINFKDEKHCKTWNSRNVAWDALRFLVALNINWSANSPSHDRSLNSTTQQSNLQATMCLTF